MYVCMCVSVSFFSILIVVYGGSITFFGGVYLYFGYFYFIVFMHLCM